MSTYYYLACEQCKEAVFSASQTASGKCVLPGNGGGDIASFVVYHAGHMHTIISEDDDQLEAYLRWDLDNYQD